MFGCCPLQCLTIESVCVSCRVVLSCQGSEIAGVLIVMRQVESSPDAKNASRPFLSAVVPDRTQTASDTGQTAKTSYNTKALAGCVGILPSADVGQIPTCEISAIPDGMQPFVCSPQ